MQRLVMGFALAVMVAAGVPSAGARECCNVMCGQRSPVCIASDDLNCDQLCDAECEGRGGCTSFGASTCSPDLAVVSCDGECQAVCATFTPTPAPATAAPTMSPGLLVLMAAVLGGLAVAVLRQRRPQ